MTLRGAPLRQQVLDAAERLLRQGKAEFSMRQLAAEAGVSFATPFNQFGSKAAIMLALSARRIDTMEERFASAALPEDAIARIGRATDVASAVMLEEPEVSRTVMGWLGTPGAASGHVLEHSSALWARALGAGNGLAEARREDALRDLPRQLAFAFRGVLSFWTAGELPDEALATEARRVAQALLLGFVDRSDT
ncbi:TetR/AcrR family transcriptional regulator [Sphingomonas sp. ASY06-1R]|uniref:TetR/AcrR family transcriptional regulator n=1 Tax=Sphingomonas sp. ASY06-1R TaxID=3445771 RepID=UPI003FA23C0C